MEKQRFYRAVSKGARFGGPGEFAKRFAFTFRADNLALAKAHADHCFAGDPRGLSVDVVQFIGTTEPEGMGQLVKVGN